MQYQADGVICLRHNLWCEDPERTEEDNRLIAALFETGKTLKTPLLDFLIINRENYVSVCDPYENYKDSEEGEKRLRQIAKDWGPSSLKNRKKAKWHQTNESVKRSF